MKCLSRFYSLSILFIVLLSSCSNSRQEGLLEQQPSLNETILSASTDNMWTAEEAVQNVQNFILGIEGSGSFRNATFKVESVYPVSSLLEQGGGNLRNGQKNLSDTTLYLINFPDNGGYAIAAADKRVSPVIAYVPQGHLVGLDDIDNPGLDLYIEKAISHIKKEIQEEKWINKIEGLEHLWNIGVINSVLFYQTYGSWDKYAIPPLLKTLWHQGPPFNDNAPIINGKKAPAGCVAVAVGQIFSYFETPLQYDWSKINKFAYLNSEERKLTPEEAEAGRLMAKLLRDIGDGVNMKYGLKGSGAYSKEALEYMRSLKFSCDNLQDYSISKIKESILNGRLVYIEAFRYKDEVNKKGYTGHAWVIDGVGFCRRKIECYYEGKLVGRYFETDNIISCNWGWKKDCNGYFLAEVLTPGKPIVVNKKSEENNSKQRGRYHLDVKIIPNINY